MVRGIADSTPFALPRTEAVLHVRRLADGERAAIPDAAYCYVQVVRGRVLLEGTAPDGTALGGGGDAARLTGQQEGQELRAEGGAELLLWEMHAEPAYG